MSNFIDYLESNVDFRYVTGDTELQIYECPFCLRAERDLRVYVGVKTGLGFCHHCNTGFSPIKYIMAREGVKKAEALKILNEDDSYAKHTEVEKELECVFPSLVDVEESIKASAYLYSRGIDEDLITHFNLSVASSNVLIGDKEYKTKDRIIIPLYSKDGSIISWQARATWKPVKQKYLFCPGFPSNKNLYNYHKIEQNPNYIIICEGVFDCFGWWRSGFKNCVATYGKKISEEQIFLLRQKNPKMILIAWDWNEHYAKNQFCEKYSCFFPLVKIVDLPENKDADDCSKEELIESVRNAYKYDWSKKILSLIG